MMQRTRTVTWDDPVPAARAAVGMAGIDYLRAIADGAIPPPPVAALLGLELLTVEPGEAVFELDPGEYHYNPIGTVHGGMTSTMLDSAMGCAVHSMLEPGTAYTTLELKVNFVRPVTRDTGRIRAQGRVLHLGTRSATAEGRVVDADGKLYAHATTTCLIWRS